MERTILHCDCNSFYASVETLLDPTLADGPSAVCGDPESRHGIILAKNEKAKAFGVQTAETIWQAKRKCPDLRLVAPHREEYVKYSRRCNELYLQYTDLVDPFGIDESFLDVTGSTHLFGTGEQIADELRRRMREEIGLTISVGVSFNRAFAKLGSDYKKPDATTVFSRENFRERVWPLPANALLYVGRRAAARLDGLGIHTIGDLAACEPVFLHSIFGKQGDMLLRYARGEDDEPVRSFYAEREVKSVGNGMTFAHDLSDAEDIRWAVALLSDSVATRLRRQGVYCHAVQVQVKDPRFRTVSRQRRLSAPTCVAREIARAALSLLEENRHAFEAIRTLTVTGEQIVRPGETQQQVSLFQEEDRASRERQLRLEQAMDRIRDKYGRDAISTGRLMERHEDGAHAPE